MNQPATAFGTGICKGPRMIVIATNDFGRFSHVAPGRTNRRQVNHYRVLRNTSNHLGVCKVCAQELKTRIRQMLLNAVGIKIYTKHPPRCAFKNSAQQVTTNKTTATHKGYGD